MKDNKSINPTRGETLDTEHQQRKLSFGMFPVPCILCVCARVPSALSARNSEVFHFHSLWYCIDRTNPYCIQRLLQFCLATKVVFLQTRALSSDRNGLSKEVIHNRFFFGYGKDSLMMDNLSALTTFTKVAKCIPNNLVLGDILIDAEVMFSFTASSDVM